jgi:exonuclease 3'-5' domain-containing protein 1
MAQCARVHIVDSPSTLISLLDDCATLSVNPPSLYLDLEGIRLGRQGSISIISIYVAPTEKVYLIDVHGLGRTAFSTENSSAISLKSILESAAIPKVIFDVRNDSDALYSHFQVSVNGIKDLQLMELATRQGPKDFVAGLAKCIQRDSVISTTIKAEWQRTKDGISRMYDPKKGGRYEIFNERPLHPDIVRYCAGDVSLLPGLYKTYNSKLHQRGQNFWLAEVEKETRDRIKLSQSPGYDGQAKDKARGPWDQSYIDEAIDDWNENVLSNALHGD